VDSWYLEGLHCLDDYILVAKDCQLALSQKETHLNGIKILQATTYLGDRGRHSFPTATFAK